MRDITFSPTAWKQLTDWHTDKKTSKKIIKLIDSIARTPEEGIGKPEALKNEFTGFWSRHINEKDRIIYTYNDNQIKIVRCKGHYDDK